MSEPQTTTPRLTPEPLPANLTSTQPGGGTCYSLELAWGHLRRWWLRTFRPGYVARMAMLRQGDPAGCPIPLLDPRDLKYYRNVCTAHWQPEDDPFQWRERLGLARWGLAELLLMGTPMAVFTVLALVQGWLWAAIPPAIVFGWLVWFFRDPARTVPNTPGLVVSPADGRIADVQQLDYDEFIGGPAVRIGIFLSIFNVHINRVPVRSRIIALRYCPGKFLNALNPTSALVNESLWIGLEDDDAPQRRMVVRQIAGLFARRIVCDLRPGQTLERGAKFGMIKLGSRTELIVPATDGLVVDTAIGQKVQAGSTVLARYTR